MKKTIFSDPVRSFTHACDCYRSGNPMKMHKSFRMEDVYFRKDSPNDEVFRVEFGMDAEQYLIVAAAAALGLVLVCKVVSAAKHSAERKRMKAALRRKCR